MRAAIYQGQGRIDLVDLPTPVAGPKDVVIRNVRAGVCGSDVSAYLHGPQAHKITPGIEFGHEAICEVVEVGRDVVGFAPGERVYPYPVLARGDMSRAGTMGAFSEYLLVPDAQPGVQLYPVPEAVSDTVGALIEPFTIAMQAATRAEPRPGETAVVWGAGTIGIGTAIALREHGLDKVLVVDLSDYRLALAGRLGFATVNSGRDDLRAAATDYFGTAAALDGPTADVDIFVDAAGADSLIHTFQTVGKFGARLVTVAVHAQPIPVDFANLAYRQHRISGSGGYTPEGVRRVLDVMAAGRWDIASIVTHEFPLEQIETAINVAADPQSALNVAIVHQPRQ